jgi:hypothetical protein
MLLRSCLSCLLRSNCESGEKAHNEIKSWDSTLRTCWSTPNAILSTDNTLRRFGRWLHMLSLAVFDFFRQTTHTRTHGRSGEGVVRIRKSGVGLVGVILPLGGQGCPLAGIASQPQQQHVCLRSQHTGARSWIDRGCCRCKCLAQRACHAASVRYVLLCLM